MGLGNLLHKPYHILISHHILISAFILLGPSKIKLVMFLLTSEKQDWGLCSSEASCFSTCDLHYQGVLKLVE